MLSVGRKIWLNSNVVAIKTRKKMLGLGKKITDEDLSVVLYFEDYCRTSVKKKNMYVTICSFYLD